jgi:hypothetical protein
MLKRAALKPGNGIKKIGNRKKKKGAKKPETEIFPTFGRKLKKMIKFWLETEKKFNGNGKEKNKKKMMEMEKK